LFISRTHPMRGPGRGSVFERLRQYGNWPSRDGL